jgi:sulfite exporter TauE/SafE
LHGTIVAVFERSRIEILSFGVGTLPIVLRFAHFAARFPKKKKKTKKEIEM